MSITRVLIVDDSSFFRRRLNEIFDADKHIEVIGTASNGREAVNLVEKLRPDVVTMDIEMPIMDGITAVKKIMKICPTPILMFSSLTTQGAKATLDALDAGAVDFMSKSLSDISEDRDVAKRQLCARVRLVGARGISHDSNDEQPSLRNLSIKNKKKGPDIGNISDYELIIIGTSTGGPVAIQKILSSLRSGYDVPIVIIQHMPESFTGPFSQRLDAISKIDVSLAKDGDIVMPGHVYIAPGAHQLKFSRAVDGKLLLDVKRSDDSYTYKPCVDVSFKSAAEICSENTLAIVLTGMGSDGKNGAKDLKSSGAKIIAQDEASSIVYGMPMSIAKAGLCDVQLSLTDIAKMVSGK